MICILNRLFKQVGFTLLQATKALRDSRGIAYSIFDLGTRRDEGSASRPGRPLPPGKTQYPFKRRLGGLQGESGQVPKISPPTSFDPRTVQPVGSRYTDYATRPTIPNCSGRNNRPNAPTGTQPQTYKYLVKRNM